MKQDKRHYDLEKEPNYRLEFHEPVYFKPPLRWWMIAIRTVISILVFYWFLFSVVGQEKVLWDELPLVQRLFLAALMIYLFRIRGQDIIIPSPMELWFYDDYFIIYRHKMNYYYGKLKLREYNIIDYATVTKFSYSEDSSFITIHADIYEISYKFDKNGVLSKKPKHRYTEKTVELISRAFLKNIDVKKEVEEHSPIKVKIVSR